MLCRKSNHEPLGVVFSHCAISKKNTRCLLRTVIMSIFVAKTAAEFETQKQNTKSISSNPKHEILTSVVFPLDDLMYFNETQ